MLAPTDGINDNRCMDRLPVQAPLVHQMALLLKTFLRELRRPLQCAGACLELEPLSICLTSGPETGDEADRDPVTFAPGRRRSAGGRLGSEHLKSTEPRCKGCSLHLTAPQNHVPATRGNIRGPDHPLRLPTRLITSTLKTTMI